MSTETNILAECNHVKASGLQCHAIAMRSHRFCYFHARAAQRKRIQYNVFSSFRTEYAHHPESLPKHSTWQDCTAKLFDALDLPTIEDASSLAVFYNALIHATANQMISERRGATIHRMLRSCFVVLDKLEFERRPVENQTRSVFIADPEPLADPYAPQFTMEHATKFEEPIEESTEESIAEAAAIEATDGVEISDSDSSDLQSTDHQINKSKNDSNVLDQLAAFLSTAESAPGTPISRSAESKTPHRSVALPAHSSKDAA